MTTRCAVYGTGSWGTAFAMVLADAGCEVALWGRRADLVDVINTTHINPDYLPGIELPQAVTATADPELAARGADFVILAVPSQTLRGNLAEWAPLLPPKAVLVSHQLPIWITRLDAEDRSFVHDPRRRQCGLASLTSFTFDGNRLVAVTYTEPAADLAARASKAKGA